MPPWGGLMKANVAMICGCSKRPEACAAFPGPYCIVLKMSRAAEPASEKSPMVSKAPGLVGDWQREGDKPRRCRGQSSNCHSGNWHKTTGRWHCDVTMSVAKDLRHRLVNLWMKNSRRPACDLHGGVFRAGSVCIVQPFGSLPGPWAVTTNLPVS